jgi:NCAIR mutase (PurE)-related protein
VSTTRETLTAILAAVRDGDMEVPAAMERLGRWPYEDTGFARLDHHRALRGGFPEVVYCPGKSAEQVAIAVARLAAEHGVVLATRATPEQAAAAAEETPDAEYRLEARAIVVDRRGRPPAVPGVLVVSAGTSDGQVAAEAALTAELLGCIVERTDDVGVAGLHRLLERLPQLQAARVVVVVAGMEGALPGVVAGLIEAPVIAVPTSVGYGTHLGGLAPLFTMLNSCATGLAVVNIDNGYAAGHMAALIARQVDVNGAPHP